MADQTGSRLPDDPTTAWYAEYWDQLALPAAQVEPVAGYRITAERWYADGTYVSPSGRYPLLPPEADDVTLPRDDFRGWVQQWTGDPVAAAMTVLLVLSVLAALIL